MLAATHQLNQAHDRLTKVFHIKHLHTSLDDQVLNGLASLICSYAGQSLAVVADSQSEDWPQVSAVVLDKLDPTCLLFPKLEMTVQ